MILLEFQCKSVSLLPALLPPPQLTLQERCCWSDSLFSLWPLLSFLPLFCLSLLSLFFFSFPTASFSFIFLIFFSCCWFHLFLTITSWFSLKNLVHSQDPQRKDSYRYSSRAGLTGQTLGHPPSTYLDVGHPAIPPNISGRVFVLNFSVNKKSPCSGVFSNGK